MKIFIISLIYILFLQQELTIARQKFDHIVEECEPKKTCNGEGMCILQNNKKKCICLEQYYSGKACETVADNCDKNILSSECKANFGSHTCINMFGRGYCQCLSGFQGQFCDLRVKLIPHWCQKFNMYFKRREAVNEKVKAILVCDPINNIFPNNLHQHIVVNFFEQLFQFSVGHFRKMNDEVKSHLNTLKVPLNLIDNSSFAAILEFDVIRKGGITYKAILTDDYRFYAKGWSGYAIEMDGPYEYAAFNDPRQDGCLTEIRLLGAGASPFFGSAALLLKKKQYKVTSLLEVICSKDDDEENEFTPERYTWSFYTFGNLSDFYIDFDIHSFDKLTKKHELVGYTQNAFKLEDFYQEKKTTLSRKFAVVNLNITEGNATDEDKKMKMANVFGWMIIPETALVVSKIEGGTWVYASFTTFNDTENLVTFSAISYKDHLGTEGTDLPSGRTDQSWSCTSDDSACRKYCDYMRVQKDMKMIGPTWQLIMNITDRTLSDCDIKVRLITIFNDTANYRGVTYNTMTSLAIKLRLDYDLDMFGIKCLRNCFWVDYDDDHVYMDPHEFLYVRVTCFEGRGQTCSKEDEYVFNWGFLNSEEDAIYSDELFHYMDEPNVAIIYKPYMLQEMPQVFIVLGGAKDITYVKPKKVAVPGKKTRISASTYTNETRFNLMAEFKFETRAIPIRRHVDPSETVARYETCPPRLQYRGYSFTTEYELCIPDVSKRFTSFSYIFYQKCAEFTPGVLIAWGQSNYVTKILLAASDMTSISVYRVQDLTGIQTELFHDPVYVTPRRDVTDLKAHFNFIFKIFNGTWSRFGSVKTHAQYMEFGEIVQKYNALIYEKQIMYSTRMDLDTIYFIDDYMRKMFLVLFKNMTQASYTMSIEALQISTIYHEILMFSSYPLVKDFLEVIPETIESLAQKAIPLFNPSDHETRMHRILEFTGRLIESLSVCVYPNDVIFTNLTSDSYTDNIILTAKEPSIPLELEPLSEDTEDYPYPTIDKEITDYLTKASYKTMTTVPILSHIVAEYLIPREEEILDETTSFPGVIFERARSKIDWSFYVNIKTAQKNHFVGLGEIGNPVIGVVKFDKTFCANQPNAFFALEFIVAPYNPFMWTNRSRFVIKYPFMIVLSMSTAGYTQNIKKNARAVTKAAQANATAAKDKHKKKKTKRRVTYLEEDNKQPRSAIPGSKTTRQSGSSSYIEEELRVVFPVKFPQNFSMGEAVYYRDRGKMDSRDICDSKFSLTVKEKTPSMLIFEFNLVDKTATINVFFTSSAGSINVKKAISRNDRMVGFNYPRELPGAKPPFDITIVVQPSSPRNTLYGVSVSGVECLAWKSVTQIEWEQGCNNRKIDVHIRNSTISCVCETSKTTVYAIAIRPVSLKSSGCLTIEIGFNIQSSVVCIITLCVFLTMYLVLLYKGFSMDRNDYDCKAVHYLLDNRKCETYPYIVIVHSGSDETTSNIGIKLHGTCENSKRHVLRGMNDSARSMVEYYILTTDVRLGKIKSIELWSDYRGHSPQWYCEKVIIRSPQENYEWEFIVNELFSLTNEKFDVHHHKYIIYQETERTLYQKMFNTDKFVEKHLWFGMLRRQWCHGFSRVEHVTCAFAVMFFAMAAEMFVYGVVELNSKAEADYCYIKWKYAVKMAFACLAVVFMVYPFLYIFRNSEMKRSFYIGIDPTSIPYTKRIPWIIKIFAFIFLICMMILAVGMVAYFGFSYGYRKSVTWLFSLLIFFVFEVFIVESFHVLIRNFLYYIALKKDDVLYFCHTRLNYNFENQVEFASKTCKNRILKKDMARPLTKTMRIILRAKEERFFRYKTFLVKNILFIFLFVCLLYLVSDTTQHNAYYHSLVYKKMFQDGIYTRTEGLKHINDNKRILKFLNYTLLITTNWRKPCWLISGERKILGKIRLRQLRVKPFLTCIVHKPMVHYATEICHGPLTPEYMDKKTYGSKWRKFNKTENNATREPYKYNEGKYKEYMTPTYGRQGIIPNGGYYAYLGRTLLGSRKILNKLYDDKWFDLKTRFVLVEFASYSADSNFLAVVKLIIEKTPSDSYHTAHQIIAIRLRRPDDSHVPYLIGMLLIPVSYAFVLTLICYFYFMDRSALSFRQYFRKYLKWYDLFMMFFILAYLVCFQTLQIAQKEAMLGVGRVLINKKFEDFTYLVQILFLTQYVGGFLLFLNLTFLLMFLANNDNLRPYFDALNLCRNFGFPMNFMTIIVLGGIVLFGIFNVETFGTILKFLMTSISPNIMYRYLGEWYPYLPNSIVYTFFIGLYSAAIRLFLVLGCIVVLRLQYFAALEKNKKDIHESRLLNKFKFDRYLSERFLRQVDDMDKLRRHYDERRYMNMKRVEYGSFNNPVYYQYEIC